MGGHEWETCLSFLSNCTGHDCQVERKVSVSSWIEITNHVLYQIEKLFWQICNNFFNGQNVCSLWSLRSAWLLHCDQLIIQVEIWQWKQWEFFKCSYIIILYHEILPNTAFKAIYGYYFINILNRASIMGPRMVNIFKLIIKILKTWLPNWKGSVSYIMIEITNQFLYSNFENCLTHKLWWVKYTSI